MIEDNLSYELIEEKPESFNFGEGYTETWDVVRPNFYDLDESELKKFLDDAGYSYEDDDSEDKLAEMVGEYFDESYMPIYNFLYPLGEYFEIPKALEHIRALSNTTIIEKDEKHYLALTGCGMDMTWEIIESYINLGYYPPVHFCNPPSMMGRGESEKDKQIIKACKKSLEAMKQRIEGKLETLKNIKPIG